MPQRWKHRPPGSNWGDFGPDDQKGRLNLLTPEKVLEGIAEVTEGISFCLSLPLDYPGGNAVNARRFPPQLRPTYLDGRPYYNMRWGDVVPGLTDVAADDVVVLHTQYSTQWDSLAHIGSVFDADGDGVPEPLYYNGFRAGEDVTGPEGENDSVAARALGIENMAETSVQGRGVMIDLFAHYGTKRAEVGMDALTRIMDEDGVTVEKGDMLLLHTGFAQVILDMNKEPDAEKLHAQCPVLDSRDPRLLEWVADSGVAIIAADNHAVEDARQSPDPGFKGARLPLHELCLFKLGIHLGELWYLTELANWLRDHSRSRFLLTAPPLRLTGAVGSPATPVATV